MAENRWDRLANDLRAAGLSVRLDARPYQERVGGRMRSGVSKSITFQVKGKGTVAVHDQWWHKNPDKWIGWEIYAEDTDSIQVGTPRLSKWRSEVVTIVQEMLAGLR